MNSAGVQRKEKPQAPEFKVGGHWGLVLATAVKSQLGTPTFPVRSSGSRPTSRASNAASC